MVIGNIWKQGKISEPVYKYVQVCCLLPTDYKLMYWKLHQADGLRLHQWIVVSVSGSCCTRVSVGPHQQPQLRQQWLFWVLEMSWYASGKQVFQEPPQEKIWLSKVRWPSRRTDVAETRDNSFEQFRTTAILFRVVWAVAPSCWKWRAVGSMPSRLNWGSTNPSKMYVVGSRRLMPPDALQPKAYCTNPGL